MKRTEIIFINRNPTLDYYAHISKNLYNQATYLIKQSLKENKLLSYYDLNNMLKDSENYKELPTQSAQQILKMVSRDWKSYFKGLKEYKNNPSKFKNRPKPPSFKPKDGSYMLIFTNQQCKIKDGKLRFPRKINLTVPTRLPDNTNIREVRLISILNNYKVEIIYEKEPTTVELNNNKIVSIDLGMKNIITMVNNFGDKPIIIKDNGKGIKSINQFFNKVSSYLKSIYDKQNIKSGKKLRRLINKRNFKVSDWIHKVSRFVVDYCIKNKVSKIIIGYNDDWKQEVSLGKRNNQTFTLIPFKTLIDKIVYKAEEYNIKVVLVEESYTSQMCSNCGVVRKSSRKYRGLYVCSKCGKVLNADINGAFNIMKKVFSTGQNVFNSLNMLLTPKAVYI
ncbi:MAG: putative transposase [Methanothermococcus sp.]|jgi:IS605 OrfB family transposase|uniref:RNA-guided endonuclease InsQ/TnpB family protein n=1 Tax=Methanothermococcus TaxID=155862 RepID=UPI0003824174|nr:MULTISPECIES: RNA-guided endonuclease TnpB family protein [Methanothermococcus]MDK2790531.1 putative transposase [Methanothermococcus sp.]MDK2987258.1 putative transposase [Methanothermococcus sp.]